MTVGYFDNDVGGFDGGDGEYSGLKPELVRGLPAHQRDNAKRSGLNLDLRHNGVAYDSRYQAAHAVSSRFADHRLRALHLAAGGQLFGEAREHCTFDGPAATFGDGGEAACIRPPPKRVIADAQQLGRFTDAKGRCVSHKIAL